MIGDNGEVVTSDVIKANMFNEHYATVGVIDDGNIYTCPHIELTSIVETVIFNEHDILVAANKLKPNLSTGPDGLPPLLFKRLRFSLARPLACLFAQLFSVGAIPDDWKMQLLYLHLRRGLLASYLITGQYL